MESTMRTSCAWSRASLKCTYGCVYAFSPAVCFHQSTNSASLRTLDSMLEAIPRDRQPWKTKTPVGNSSGGRGFERQCSPWSSLPLSLSLFAKSLAMVPISSYKKVFWKYVSNLQENTHAKVWFQLSCFASLNFCKFAAYFYNTFL